MNAGKQFSRAQFLIINSKIGHAEQGGCEYSPRQKMHAWYEQLSLVYSCHLCYEYSGAFQPISSVSYYLLYIDKHITFYLLYLAIYSLGAGLFSNSSLYFIIPIGQCHYFKNLNLKYIFRSHLFIFAFISNILGGGSQRILL